MVSVIITLKNRANLLKWGLEGLLQLIGSGYITEILIADGGSEDNLDFLIEEYSKKFKCSIEKHFLDRNKSPYNHTHNCPAWEYNWLVQKAKNKFIIKIDPEFVFITPNFLVKGINILHQNPNAIYIPFPHHTYEFELKSIKSITYNYPYFVYPTHLNEELVNQGTCRLVYYGCMFRKQAFIDLGGIDMRFVEGIGSEDDHFLDQWERKYAKESVVCTTGEKGVHLWHGDWGRAVPQEFNDLVLKNRELRNQLVGVFPNDGDFNKIKYENI